MKYETLRFCSYCDCKQTRKLLHTKVLSETGQGKNEYRTPSKPGETFNKTLEDVTKNV